MKVICSYNEFQDYFGRLTDDTLHVLTVQYPLLRIQDKDIVFNFKLNELFDDAMDLFSMDPDTVNDMFVLNEMFTDENISPEIITSITDWLCDIVEHDPISENGELWLTFNTIRYWYGDDFDKDMSVLYTEYKQFQEHFDE